MAGLKQYEAWIVELENDRRPEDLSHIGMSVSGAARFLSREIMSFDWPAVEHQQAKELAARAKAVGDKTLAADLDAYLTRRDKGGDSV